MVRSLRLLAASAVLVLTASVASCAASGEAGSTGSSAGSEVSSSEAVSSGLWDSSTVHSISISFDQTEYDAMIETYLSSGDKEWISATVVIDGETYQDVGLKLKGNSSLRGLSSESSASLSSENPEDLPWLIRLDEFVDGQSHEGSTELVVRGNGSETSLNEAVALTLLDEAGLAAENAIAVRFSAGGSDETLRLVIENPDDSWMERELGDGMLYKAETGGDYSYRGDDPDAYTDVFDQEAGEDDLTPLIDFLEWLDESDDATFQDELAERLDVDAFATYLAFQELVDNFDDIDGPGNNSYLYYDPDTGLMTVVNWDLNLAFGGSPGGGGAGGGDRGDGAGMGPQAGGQQGAGDRGGAAGLGGSGGGSNILSERFLENDAFHALYESELDRLTELLIDSGTAEEVLDSWTATLLDGAGDLLDTGTIESESSALADELG